MKFVAVLENPGEYFSEALARTIGLTDDVVLLGTSRVEDLSKRRCDLVVVSPGYARSSPPAEHIGCKSLLTPDGLFYSPRGAKSVITYGMSPQSTLTLSSVGSETSIMAIQREIVNSHGNIIEQQEMNVSSSGDPDITLASAGGRILLGLSASPNSYIQNNTI